jgi:hypothetical protein
MDDPEPVRAFGVMVAGAVLEVPVVLDECERGHDGGN